ncbi:MAG TPA: STAS domain-containing protein [Candidatus Acidoferrum sp.]|jgi:anti-anti-sigma factor
MLTLQFARHEIGAGVTALAIKGSVHCGTECTQLESEVNGLLAEKQTRLILDLSAVTTMDSAAIGAIVRCFRKLKSVGGDLGLAAAPPVIARILDQTKVNKIVPTFASVADAAANFAASAQS